MFSGWSPSKDEFIFLFFGIVFEKWEKFVSNLTVLKFVFSKKATKIDEIFTVNLTLTT